MTSAADDYTTRVLTSRWTAVPEDTLGGWCVTCNGLTPANGGVTVADMMTRELAEHIASLHNQWLTTFTVTLGPASAVVRGERHDMSPQQVDPELFMRRYRDLLATYDSGRTNQTREETP